MRLKCSFFYGILIFVFSLNPSYTFAASLPTADSSVQPTKPHKLSQQQFLERYGTDDSSRALINYYFPERHTASVLALYSGGTLALAGSLAGIVLSNGNGVEDGLGDFFALLILLVIAYTTAPLLLVGTALLLGYSRKRLYKMLQAYHAGNRLPRRIIRKKSFLRLLKIERLKNRIEN